MSRLILPSHFRFGTATSAFQIEGGWDADGKGPSIWDTFGHEQGRILGGNVGDVACDSYHRWQDDIALLSDLGMDSYRFSLSWPRLMPTGTGQVNQAGVDYYDRLIDGLLEAGIDPNVTLYHWDLPQALEDRGGWAVREVADWFGEYAAVAFDRFGDRVRRWSTLNEPIAIWVGYGLGIFAPGHTDEKAGRAAMHHAMLAHGKAVQEFRAAGSPGEIGIVLDIWKRHPLTDSDADRRLADEGDDDGFRFFLDALRGGGYSDRIRERLTADGTMPDVRQGDFDLIAQPIDYLGLNVYSRVVVDASADPSEPPAQHAGGNFLDNGQEFYPKAAYDALKLLHDDYGWDGPIYVTENGMSDGPNTVGRNDDERIEYVSAFLEWIARAVEEGSDVRGYYLWSLLDNVEWAAGKTLRYGITAVDPETLERQPKKSALWYRDLVAAHRATRD